MTLRSLCQWPTHFLHNVTIVQKNYLSWSVMCGWLGDRIRMQIIHNGFIIFCTVFVFAQCPHISSEAQSVVGSLSAHYLVITHNLLQQTCYKDRQPGVFFPKLTETNRGPCDFSVSPSPKNWVLGFWKILSTTLACWNRNGPVSWLHLTRDGVGAWLTLGHIRGCYQSYYRL